MRILYLHPRSWTGERTILPVLRDYGHEVCILEEKRGMEEGKWFDSTYFETPGDRMQTCWYDPGRGWEKLVTWPFDRIFRRGFEGRNLVHRMWMILRAVSRMHPDVIMCSDGFTFALPASFLRQLRILQVPLVCSYIGGDILDCPHAEIGRSRKGMTGWLIARSYGGIDVLRPVSPMLQDVLIGDGVDEKRTRICPSHLVASAETTGPILTGKKEARRRIRHLLDIPEEAPLIVTLSANILGKGLHVLARAWPEVVRRLPEARWLLCGPENSWFLTEVLPILQSEGLASTTVRTGPLTGDSVFEHLAAADLHVNPSLCEGLNMVTVEAGAVGTPTVTTSGAGIASWIKRFNAGVVVPAGDVTALADAIIKMLSEPRCLSECSAAAIDMSGEFAPDLVARELLDIFQSAIKQSTPAR